MAIKDQSTLNNSDKGKATVGYHYCKNFLSTELLVNSLQLAANFNNKLLYFMTAKLFDIWKWCFVTPYGFIKSTVVEFSTLNLIKMQL